MKAVIIIVVIVAVIATALKTIFGISDKYVSKKINQKYHDDYNK